MIVGFFSPFIVEVIYETPWRLRQHVDTQSIMGRGKRRIYNCYFERFSSYIGYKAQFLTPPVFPHKYFGIFISNSAVIGRNAVIFQQVTIGSNTIPNSKGYGAPVIGDNVYIGAGAKIIGKVHIGNNVRIGANCIVVKDIPDNSVVIQRGMEIIIKSDLDNRYISNNDGNL